MRAGRPRSQVVASRLLIYAGGTPAFPGCCVPVVDLCGRGRPSSQVVAWYLAADGTIVTQCHTNIPMSHIITVTLIMPTSTSNP
jgi:hypothetical protein